jgi:hypothetical protein
VRKLRTGGRPAGDVPDEARWSLGGWGNQSRTKIHWLGQHKSFGQGDDHVNGGPGDAREPAEAIIPFVCMTNGALSGGNSGA